MTKILFAMDRGYVASSLLYDFIILSGADILGTNKRIALCFKLHPIKRWAAKHAIKAILLKKKTVCNKTLTGVAYQNSKGSVTLGLTTSI